MTSTLIGIAMLIGGPTIAVINVLEWLRWRAGKQPLLGGALDETERAESAKRDMNKAIQGMELVGWTVGGLFLGVVGFAIVFPN
ncbi:MAG: hypothetical protein ABL912_06665 [Novosphingobium sp.]